MKKQKKTFREKLREDKGLPRIVNVPKEMDGKWGVREGDTMLIPAPVEVDAVMKSVPEGKLITIDQIRETLARKHGTTISCPLTTGIFASIAAHAAEEEKADGKKEITPYWRTLRKGGELNEKYPGGAEAQKKLLENEGHTVVKKGRKFFVQDYEKKLVKL
ncbi:MAG: MGMT family protein [Thermoplasmata archaeon]